MDIPKTILVVAAHPDDEMLGCGGTIARRLKEGDRVHVVIMAEGITSRTHGAEEEVSMLHAAAARAHDTLGTTSLTFHRLPDNRMDSVPLLDIVKIIENHVIMMRPDIVYTHHGNDMNIDHNRTHDAVLTACRPTPECTVRTILFFEVPSSTEWRPSASFQPNWFEDIAETLPAKMEALRHYRSEIREWPHPRSYDAVEHLARWRGATAGVEAAEAFMLGRNIRRRG